MTSPSPPSSSSSSYQIPPLRSLFPLSTLSTRLSLLPRLFPPPPHPPSSLLLATGFLVKMSVGVRSVRLVSGRGRVHSSLTGDLLLQQDETLLQTAVLLEKCLAQLPLPLAEVLGLELSRSRGSSAVAANGRWRRHGEVRTVRGSEEGGASCPMLCEILTSSKRCCTSGER
ncbi:hypothetical protein BDZ90DRAFT_121813 [Jaminaea rosea]|uniref:Uncharacterized protein n=1 Tax=Jaminaea rosea TaxID=1569628 RepID=A0A316UX44_9BASI|nr:hypothetical protein BDZ90DRAFT_121813 [Jaminaea rosea]PWN29876.1 hypothetical protein BDZ90DRAFT_121813 [Jaminaea rosea]